MAIADEFTERTLRQDTSINRAVLSMLAGAIRDKSLLWVAMLGAIGLWVFTAIKPDYLRLIAAFAYSATVLWPMLWRRGG